MRSINSKCVYDVDQDILPGPPGTGKTSTISEASKIWARSNSPTWIVAHSNVAVKNIAEKLVESNIDFKIIVSKEFYVEWWARASLFATCPR